MAEAKKKRSKRPKTIATRRAEAEHLSFEEAAVSAAMAGLVQGFAFKIASGAGAKAKDANIDEKRVDGSRVDPAPFVYRTCGNSVCERHYLCGARMVSAVWVFCPYCAGELRMVDQ